MRDLKKKILCAALVCTMLSSFTSCLRNDIDTPSETGGIGRIEKENGEIEEEGLNSPSLNDDEDSYVSPPLDNSPDGENGESGEAQNNTQSGQDTSGYIKVIDGVSYKYENGRYYYNFAYYDRSNVQSKFATISNMSRALFADQGDDTTGSWYFGKTTRDPSTGEVTYVWDRYASTVDSIKNHNGIYRGDETQKVCYLTFDCGYEIGCTAKILDTLKEKGVAGTFFMTGQFIKTAPEEVKRIIEEGHIPGNHTQDHINCTQASCDDFKDQIEANEKLMSELYGYEEQMRFWRPPYGAASDYVLSMADAMGLFTTMYSFAYYDYDENAQPSYSEALEKCKGGLHNGCVYLLHNTSTTNAAILGDLIDYIKSQGYEILPVCAALGK